MTNESGNIVRFEQTGDAACQLTNDARLAFLHLREVERNTGRVNTVFAEFVLHPVKELG